MRPPPVIWSVKTENRPLSSTMPRTICQDGEPSPVLDNLIPRDSHVASLLGMTQRGAKIAGVADATPAGGLVSQDREPSPVFGTIILT